MNKAGPLSCALFLLFFISCATSNHGAFVTSTYVDPKSKTGNKVAGRVTGESHQTWLLYVFPLGEAPSINEAIVKAKSKIEGTRFLTDLSIDDRTDWKFGYSTQIIKVEATAYK